MFPPKIIMSFPTPHPLMNHLMISEKVETTKTKFPNPYPSHLPSSLLPVSVEELLLFNQQLVHLDPTPRVPLPWPPSFSGNHSVLICLQPASMLDSPIARINIEFKINPLGLARWPGR